MRIDDVQIGAEYALDRGYGEARRVRAVEITPKVIDSGSGKRQRLVRIVELDPGTGAERTEEGTSYCVPARELIGRWGPDAYQAAVDKARLDRIHSVTGRLADRGLVGWHAHGDLIDVRLPVHQAERLAEILRDSPRWPPSLEGEASDG